MRTVLIRPLVISGLLSGFLLFGYLVMCLANVLRNEDLSVANKLWLVLGAAYIVAAVSFVSQQKDKLFSDIEFPHD